MKNNGLLAEQITARDEGALKYLQDIQCTRLMDAKVSSLRAPYKDIQCTRLMDAKVSSLKAPCKDIQCTRLMDAKVRERKDGKLGCG